MRFLVSACLLGLPCRYDGAGKPCPAVLELAGQHELIPFCPEIYGGQPTPRPPAEIVGSKVINREGADVTAQYQRGADLALELCQRLCCQAAILKEKSPSCGLGQVYDGTFSGTLVPGNGITAQKLLAVGIAVYTEKQMDLEP